MKYNEPFKQQAERIGRGKDYFYLMRRSNKELFSYIQNLTTSGNLADGYIRYQELSNELSNTLASMYYELTEQRKLLKFSKFIYKKGIYKSEASCMNTMSKIAFISREQLMKFESFKKMKQVVALYDRFKEFECKSS